MDFGAFSEGKIAVIGDMIADEYVYAETSRISREAPVLILKESHREVRPGGAANVVANIAAMGGTPIPVGIVGGDSHGGKIWNYFQRNKIDTKHVVIDERRGNTTVIKTRVMAGSHNTVSQQMLRLDRKPDATSEAIKSKMKDNFKMVLSEVDAVIVSDYGEGTIDDELLDLITKATHKMIMVDSRYRIDRFESVHTLVPNVDEIRAATRNNDLTVAVSNLFDRTNSNNILLKRGKNGMSIHSQPRTAHSYSFPAYGSDEIADVTGAGDTVIAAYTLAVMSGHGFGDAAMLANVAGGVQVMKAGTATVSKSDLIGHWAAYKGSGSTGCTDANCECKGSCEKVR